MTEGLVDLHIHSNFSCDGDFSPEELVRMAQKQKFRAMAIADHDTVEAYPQAIQIGKEWGIEIIPSIEVTTIFDSREFHLLLPFVDWESEAIHYIISKMESSRLEEAQARVQRLKEKGIEITWEEVEEKCGGIPPLGVKIAQIVLDKPESQENPLFARYYEKGGQTFAPYLFYQDYFSEGGVAYVPKKHIRLEEVLKLAPQTGGVPVLSHPGAYFQRTTRDDLAYLKSLGLEGLEVYTSYHSVEEAQIYQALAADFDLVATAGSDFHGRIKPRVSFGQIKEGNYEMVEKLKQRKKQ
jgi:predicted metal-dependent phosphoesterase TrpH